MAPADVAVLSELRSQARAAASPRDPVHAAWRRIEQWLEAHHPLRTDMLAEGAVPTELTAFEEALGFALPEALRASLLEHDGESDAAVGLLYGFELLSAAASLDEWRSMQAVAAGWKRDENRASDAIAGIQPVLWHPHWIPIARNGSADFYCVDAAPAAGGSHGQVFFRSHETGPEAIVATDVTAWLTAFGLRLERSEMNVWSDGSVSDEPDPE